MNTDQTNQPQSEQKKKPLEWCDAFRELGIDIDIDHFPIGNVPCYQYLTAQEFIDLSRLTQAFPLKPCTVPATEEAPARGLPPEPDTIHHSGEVGHPDNPFLPEPVAEPEDREWEALIEELAADAAGTIVRDTGIGSRLDIISKAMKQLVAAIARGRAQARTSPGEDVVREWFEATRPRIDCTLSKTYPGQYSDRDVQLAWENFLAGVRAAQNAGEGRKP